MRHLDLIDDFIGIAELGDFETIEAALAQKSVESLLAFCVELSLSLPTQEPTSSSFSFIADCAQSGLPHPCGRLECRQAKISELIAYSSIYADTVCIVDPFSFIVQRFRPTKSAHKAIAHECAQALSLVITSTPLIKRGIATFYPFINPRICSDCYGKAITTFLSGSEADDPFFAILGELISATDVSLQKNLNGDYYYRIDGETALIEHGSFYLGPVSKRERRGLKTGCLDHQKVAELKILDGMARFATNDLLQKVVVADQINSTKIFSSAVEIKTLSKLFKKGFAANQFSADIPFLASKNVTELLELRDQEWHHFEDFRNYFDDATADACANQRAPEDVAKAIRAELVQVEKAFRTFERSANRELLDGSAICLMSLGASLMTAGLSSYLAAAAAMLGGRHFSKAIVPAIRKKFDEPEAIRESRVYYAWKVKSILER